MAVEGPIKGRFTLWTTVFDLDAQGYVAEEFLLSGSARSFRHLSQPTDDGHWLVDPVDSKDFVTRFVLNRPVDMASFSGSVWIEWLNVSGGLDAAPGWLYSHRQLMRSGDAWVGVSAQKVGIDGGGLGLNMHLKAVDPERYGRLDHPGDAYCYDIFTQASEAIRDHFGLTGDTPGPLLAMGSSQSAMALITYANAIDPHAKAVDGYLIHGRGAEGMPLGGGYVPFQYGQHRAGRHRIRNDARVPVLTVQSETDVALLGGGRARQPDAENVQLWEVAGAAHFDAYGLHASLYDDGGRTPHELAQLVAAEGFTKPSSGQPYNRGWQMHYVLQSALVHLADWATVNVKPLLTTPKLMSADADALTLVTDAQGLARGGLRTPWVDVPTAVHSGLREQGEGTPYDALFGETVAFEPGVLERLYPRRRAEYLERFAIALESAVQSGFVPADDVTEIMAVADLEWPGPG